MSTKYVFVDIDGTLLSHHTGIPRSALEAIDIARRNGHKIFINTGRVKSAVDDLLQFYPFDGFVFACGGHVEVNGDVLYKNELTEDEIKKALEIFETKNIGYVLEGPNISYYNDDAIEFFRKRRVKNEKELGPQVTRHLVQENMVYPIKHYYEDPQPVNKFSLFTKTNVELYEIEQLFGEDYEVIKYETSGEIITRGINKSHGMRTVLKHFNADIKDTMALGDSMNDYSMVKDAEVGIAMGNGVDQLKAIATYTTFDVDDHGLYHAFKKFGLI
jgi:Cof subfamily protein (haloacid dehalogenase superfamily)